MYYHDSTLVIIYAEDRNSDDRADHYTNSNGDGTYYDVWNGETGVVGDTPLQQTGLGPTRVLTFSN